MFVFKNTPHPIGPLQTREHDCTSRILFQLNLLEIMSVTSLHELLPVNKHRDDVGGSVGEIQCDAAICNLNEGETGE